MSRRLINDRAGTTALEFAVVASAIVGLFIGMLALSLGYWTKNSLEAAVEDSVRCVAIQSTNCASVTTGCDSATPAVCYTERSASLHGIPNVTAAEISTNTNVTYGGQSFTAITISYPWSFIGYSFSLSVTASFPNV